MSIESWQFAGIVTLDEYENEFSCKAVTEQIKRHIPDLETISLEGEVTTITISDLNKKLTSRLKKTFDKRLLAVYGHGRYHHFAYGLCRYADTVSKKYSYIHIDHHNDSYLFEQDTQKGILNCANFVPLIVQSTNAAEVLFIGSHLQKNKNSQLYNIILKDRNRSVLELASGKIIPEILKVNINSLLCDDVYITFDLDIMRNDEIITGFSRGYLAKDGLMQIIDAIKKEKNIIGADILGYSERDTDIERAINGYAPTAKELTEMELLSEAFDKTVIDKKEIAKLRMQQKSFELYKDIIDAII